MSPNLETMFNRNANLSTRRPLLPDERTPQIYNNGQTARTTPPVERYQHHQRYIAIPTNNYYNGYQPYYQTPERRQQLSSTNYFTNSGRYHRAEYQEPISYHSNKLNTPTTLNLDQRDAELVFRFDTHSNDAECVYDDTVRYTKGRTLNGRPTPREDGPFVFGVHSPSQFELPGRTSPPHGSRQQDNDHVKSVITNDTIDINCCDKVKKTSKCINRLFQWNRKRKTVDESKKTKKDKIKCVLVGDGAVGKTSLITAYAQNKFRSEYEPTAYDNFNVMVEVDNKPINMEICDTAGQDSMSELRELCYPGTDVLLLCFSVVRPETFRSVANRWVKACASIKAPRILVGTQADLTRDMSVLNELALRGEHVVTESEARILANAISAQYIETSAKTKCNLKDAFDSAILAALPVIPQKKSTWKRWFCWKCS